MATDRHHEFGKISTFGHMTYYLHVIRHLHSEFRVNRLIGSRDIAKNDFQYGV